MDTVYTVNGNMYDSKAATLNIQPRHINLVTAELCFQRLKIHNQLDT